MNILLTGAGFSRNWGGWLANEAFEYLLGSPEIDDEIRRRLWADKLNGKGFEDTLAEIQETFELYKDARVGLMKDALIAALVAMFNEMNRGFERVKFEPQNDMNFSISRFLINFDAIFTLNQDLLLEHHYLNDNIMLASSQRWNGYQIPGLSPLGPPSHVQHAQSAVLSMKTPDEARFHVEHRMQPYFKLHGSSNFVRDPGDRILVMGGNKASGINREPLLKWYSQQFADYLSRASKVMVIGYSFGDTHINNALLSAVASGNFRLFIVDPEGVDVLNKNRGRLGIKTTHPLVEGLSQYVVGASRRSLTGIFGGDRVEHAKLVRFLSN